MWTRKNPEEKSRSLAAPRSSYERRNGTLISSRKSYQEDREGYKSMDRRLRPIYCYVCAGTSLPKNGVFTEPEIAYRPIASCDYCALHWHLDCLTPPLAFMPPAGRRWMCPNHVEQVMPRKRTVRGPLEVKDVVKGGQWNNGNVEVVEDDSSDEEGEGESEDGGEEDEAEDGSEESGQYDGAVGDVIINKRKYKVPEKIIQMDFVNKVRGRSGAAASVSASTLGSGMKLGQADVQVSCPPSMGHMLVLLSLKS